MKAEQVIGCGGGMLKAIYYCGQKNELKKNVNGLKD
jgi:hypothetical protein